MTRVSFHVAAVADAVAVVLSNLLLSRWCSSSVAVAVIGAAAVVAATDVRLRPDVVVAAAAVAALVAENCGQPCAALSFLASSSMRTRATLP